MLLPPCLITDGVKDVKTANAIFRFIFYFLFDLSQLTSPSVSYEVLINALWWSWMFPICPQAVSKQAGDVNVDKSFQD